MYFERVNFECIIDCCVELRHSLHDVNLPTTFATTVQVLAVHSVAGVDVDVGVSVTYIVRDVGIVVNGNGMWGDSSYLPNWETANLDLVETTTLDEE